MRSQEKHRDAARSTVVSPCEIRHARAADLDQIRQIYAEPSGYAATLQLPYPAEHVWEKRFAELPSSAFSLVACRGDEIVGQLGLETRTNPRRRHVASVGMAVKTSARRQGVGAALLNAAIEMAERWLAIRRIELEVYTDNAAAIALYKRSGFVVEGTLRQFAFRNGEFVDVLAMAKLARPPHSADDALNGGI